MSFIDLFKKKTLQILTEEGVTKENIRASLSCNDAIEAAAKVTDHALKLEREYKLYSPWVSNPIADREQEAMEEELRNMAKVMKRCK